MGGHLVTEQLKVASELKDKLALFFASPPRSLLPTLLHPAPFYLLPFPQSPVLPKQKLYLSEEAHAGPPQHRENHPELGLRQAPDTKAARTTSSSARCVLLVIKGRVSPSSIIPL